MNDFAPTETPSTLIDNAAPLPGSADFIPDPIPQQEPKEEAKPMSLDEAMKKAVADTKLGEEKTKVDPKEKPEPKIEDKAKQEAKPERTPPERGENGKFTAKPKAEAESSAPPADGGEVEQEQREQRPSEGRDINRAPARFLARAQEQWAGVPADVKSEVHRTIENMEKGIAEGREAMEFRKGLRQFEDMAKQAGTTVHEALQRYVAIDQELRNNPGNALEKILATVGLTPQQYAQHILGQAQKDAQNPSAAGQRQIQTELQTLRNELAAERAERQREREFAQQREAVQHVENTLFAEVRQQHPRFDELRPTVLEIWNSNLLPSGLGEREKLYAAVDYAERLNPVANYSSSEPITSAQNAQRPLNPAGSKSVKGSPSYGAEAPRKSAKLSLDESIKAAMAQNRL